MTMLAPGITFVSEDAPPPGPAGPRTGVAFMTGLCTAGAIGTAIPIQSLQDFVNKCGPRMASSPLYDSFDLMFRNGLSQAYVSRVAGPASASATVSLMDSGTPTPLATLVISANSPGVWGNGLSVQVVAGSVTGSYQLLITQGGLPVEASPNLFTPTDAVNWAAAKPSQFVTIADDHSASPAPNNNPAVVAAKPMTGGLDDLASITEAQWTNALAAFAKDLGPGQVLAPGRTTEPAHVALIAHATANNRTFALDYADSPTATTLTADALLDQANGPNIAGGPDAGRGGAFAPQILIPGLPTGNAVPAPPRVVPPSAGFAALVARNDTDTGNQNIASAGTDGSNGGAGVLTYAIGVTQTYSDADRGVLDQGNVNVFRALAGPNGQPVVQLYDFGSLSQDPAWSQLNWQRLRMAIQDEGTAILAADLQFAQLDPQGHTLSAANGDLKSMCTRYYALGALYGSSASDAAVVDTGPAINPLSAIAAGEATAQITCRMSPYAKYSQLILVKASLGQPT